MAADRRFNVLCQTSHVSTVSPWSFVLLWYVAPEEVETWLSTWLLTQSHSAPLWCFKWMSPPSSLSMSLPYLSEILQDRDLSQWHPLVWWVSQKLTRKPGRRGSWVRASLTASCCPGWPSSRPTKTGGVSGRGWGTDACCGRRWTGCAATSVGTPRLLGTQPQMFQRTQQNPTDSSNTLAAVSYTAKLIKVISRNMYVFIWISWHRCLS